jgi:type IV pilus assembly protein PilW
VGASAGSTAISKLTQSGVGINPGDLAVLTNTANPPTTCELVEITGPPLLPVPRGNLIEHKQGAGSGYIDFTTGLPVPAATRNSAGTPAPMNISGGILYDLGARPALNRWSIVNNSLQFSNRLGDGAASTVAEGVVHLVAQYGIDDGAGGAVADDFIISPTEWRFAAPAAVPPVPANWSKVLAVRFALLARSPQFEKTAVSGNPTWSGGNFDMSAMPADWQHYRYRVYESTVAMRNMIWGTSP